MNTTSELQILNTRLQAYLRVSASQAAVHERIGPFISRFDAESDNPFLNYAIPDDGAQPGAAEIAALIAAFEARKRKPRLEYMAAVAPDVEPVLVAHGFAVEERYPVMLCSPGEERDAPVEPGFEIGIAQSDADLLVAAIVQAAAYGNEAPRFGSLKRMIAQGGVFVFARHVASGAMAGAGMATPQSDSISEVAGIGVGVEFRRRGIAGALTSRIVREAFACGVTLAWLTPGHGGAQRVYARAGFAVRSEQLHISKAI